LILIICGCTQALPTVLWHGMGDTCCNSESMGYIADLITNTTGNYVYSIKIGDTEDDDEYNGFFKNVNDQIAYVCDLLKSDPKLSGGFNAVGFSQGSQFLRAYVQRCNSPPVKNLISVGGQHQGIFGLPHCPGESSTLCETMRELLDEGAYISWIQSFLVQAEYWHDPLYPSDFLEYNIFLPDINNALTNKNITYKKKHRITQ